MHSLFDMFDLHVGMRLFVNSKGLLFSLST